MEIALYLWTMFYTPQVDTFKIIPAVYQPVVVTPATYQDIAGSQGQLQINKQPMSATNESPNPAPPAQSGYEDLCPGGVIAQGSCQTPEGDK